jgi:hypothetical protein
LKAAMQVEGVEGGDAERVEGQRRQIDGQRELACARRGHVVGGRHGQAKQAPTQLPAAGQAVDPADGIGLARLGEAGEEIVEVAHAALAQLDRVAGDRAQPQTKREDDAGQPEPAEAGPEDLRMALAGDPPALAVGAQQLEPDHVVAEAATRGMVLAMDVPGVTGGAKPRGRKTSISSAKRTPGSQTSSPLDGSKERRRSSRVVRIVRPSWLSATSP